MTATDPGEQHCPTCEKYKNTRCMSKNQTGLFHPWAGDYHVTEGDKRAPFKSPLHPHPYQLNRANTQHAYPPANSMLNDDEVVGRATAARTAFGVTKAFVEPTMARAEANAVFMVELGLVLVTRGGVGVRREIERGDRPQGWRERKMWKRPGSSFARASTRRDLHRFGVGSCL